VIVKLKYLFAMGSLLFTTAAFSQVETSKIEVSAEYSFLRFNPSLPGLTNSNFNGGGGGVAWFFSRYLGVKSEFIGYARDTWTLTFQTPLVVTPHITVVNIPAGTYSAKANMFTYQFGPVARLPFHRVTVFGEVLFGGALTDGYGNLYHSIDLGHGGLPVAGTQNTFAMAAGGGVDLRISKKVAIRLAEVDYFMTRFTNAITLSDNQNNFRYLAGIVFRSR
jgi:hypothetical protein